MTIAHSSSGTVEFDEVGTVVNISEDDDCKGELDFIVRIDVEKLQVVYPDGIPSDVDILECGYWTREGMYEPPLHWDGSDFVEYDG